MNLTFGRQTQDRVEPRADSDSLGFHRSVCRCSLACAPARALFGRFHLWGGDGPAGTSPHSRWLHAPDVDESVCRQRCNAKTDCWQQANSRWSTSREFVEVGNPAAERVGDFFHARAARILMTATANRMTAFLCLLRSRESVSCSLEMLPSFGAGKSELDHQSSNEKDRQLAPETRGHRCNSNYCKMTRQELATTMQSSSGEAIKQGPY